MSNYSMLSEYQKETLLYLSLISPSKNIDDKTVENIINLIKSFDHVRPEKIEDVIAFAVDCDNVKLYEYYNDLMPFCSYNYHFYRCVKNKSYKIMEFVLNYKYKLIRGREYEPHQFEAAYLKLALENKDLKSVELFLKYKSDELSSSEETLANCIKEANYYYSKEILEKLITLYELKFSNHQNLEILPIIIRNKHPLDVSMEVLSESN